MKRACVLLLFAVALIFSFGCKGTAEPRTPRTSQDGTIYAPPETATTPPVEVKNTPPENAPPEEKPSTPPEAGGETPAPAGNEGGEIPLPAVLKTTDVPLESAIDAVIVYVDRAAVTRIAQLNLDEGAYNLIFDKLPANVAWDSVRARGTDKVRVVNMSVKREHILQPDDPKIMELDKQLKEKQATLAEFNDNLATLTKKEALLDSIRMRTGEKASQQLEGDIDTTKLTTVMDFLDKSYNDIAARRREINKSVTDTQRDIDLINRQIADLRSKSSIENIKAVVTVVVSEKTSEPISLDYVVPGATWGAEYDLRASAKEEAAELSYFGVIHQQTGEDWKDVQLFLSTASPDIAIIPPTLGIWNIGIAQPMAESAKTMDTERYTRSYDTLQTEMSSRSTANAYILNESSPRAGVAVTYAISRRESVVSGPEPHRTIIALRKVSPKNTFITIPRLEEKAYLQAEIVNNTPFTLLPGKMSIFFGADYVGSTPIGAVAPMQTFKVNFGQDQNIKVKRARIKKFEESTGITGKYRKITYEYKITLENFKPSDVTVRVLDQMPVSTDERIVVKLLASNFPTIADEPKATENKNAGILEWRAKLPADPKRKNEIVYSYSIEYPKDLSIAGEE